VCGEGQLRPDRHQEGVFAADAQHVAGAVGDDQDGPVGREVVGALQQVDGGLQDGAARPRTFTRAATSVTERYPAS
jgi:hypothetical protein